MLPHLWAMVDIFLLQISLDKKKKILSYFVCYGPVTIREWWILMICALSCQSPERFLDIYILNNMYTCPVKYYLAVKIFICHNTDHISIIWQIIICSSRVLTANPKHRNWMENDVKDLYDIWPNSKVLHVFYRVSKTENFKITLRIPEFNLNRFLHMEGVLSANGNL